MSKANEKLYKLDKLKEYVGDSPETLCEMVGLFLQSADEIKMQMQAACSQNDPEAVGKAAHKLKPSLDIFGVSSLAVQARLIEKIHHDKEMCLNLHQVVKDFLDKLDLVVQQLQHDYSPPR